MRQVELQAHQPPQLPLGGEGRKHAAESDIQAFDSVVRAKPVPQHEGTRCLGPSVLVSAGPGRRQIRWVEDIARSPNQAILYAVDGQRLRASRECKSASAFGCRTWIHGTL